MLAALRARAAAVDWVGAGAVGVLAFPAGYVLTGLIVVLGGQTSGDVLGILLLLGFVFYSSLNVPADIVGGGQVDYLASVADPATAAPAVPIVVYYAVPIFVLVGAGALATVRLLEGHPDPVETGLTVLALAVGFAGMAVVGSFAFVSTTITGDTARIALLPAALFGFAYPLIFGLLGAALVQIVETYRI